MDTTQGSQSDQSNGEDMVLTMHIFKCPAQKRMLLHTTRPPANANPLVIDVRMRMNKPLKHSFWFRLARDGHWPGVCV